MVVAVIMIVVVVVIMIMAGMGICRTQVRAGREEGWLRARRGVGSGHACGQQRCGCFVCMRRLQAGVADTADKRVSLAMHRQRRHRSTAGGCAH